MFYKNIQNSNLYKEVQGNIRLQWLLVAILAILLLSFSKNVSDGVNNKEQQLLDDLGLLGKLSAISQAPLDENESQRVSTLVGQQLDKLPNATSMSIAEATALAFSEKNVGKTVDNLRVDIIGAQSIVLGNTRFWQVRIKIEGRLAPLKLIDFMSEFDGEQIGQRLITLQYRPGASNVLSAVFDLLYLEEGQ